MVVAAWLLLLGLLTWMFQDQLSHQANPNQEISGRVSETGLAEIHLERNRHGHYVANGTINGRTVEFLLDTGATTVAIPGRVAQSLGLQLGAPQLSRTANGTVQSYATSLEQVRLGSLGLNQVRASVLPQMQGRQVLLGMSFLKHFELVQRGDTLTLREVSAR